LNATSRFGYDAQGRVLSAADPLGTVTQMSSRGSRLGAAVGNTIGTRIWLKASR
jgi:hypothetical protein